jgi:hypothetical protein
MANTTGLSHLQASPTDPSADRDAPALPNLSVVLRVVTILLTYGRHLADTFDRRSASAGFHLIARHFGTSNTGVILAHIRRGILRAAALHHVLLKRAERGRDLVRPSHQPRRKPQAEQSAADQAIPPEPAPRKRNPHPRPSWRDDWLDGAADPLDPCHLPKFEDLVKEVRRTPYGRTLGKIYADLGIAPALSQAPYWNDLFLAMLRYGGSPGLYDLHRWRREQHFEQQQDSNPTMDLTWPPLDVGGGRSDIIRVMGFFIGEPPVEPVLILPPEPPPWIRRKSAAPAAPSEPATPPAPPTTSGAPEATGPP